MNTSRETRFTAVVSRSFHRNVSLLAQIVPPSSDFQRHFKKGMFDKPNTAGFLHVSHYLSCVYDARLFKQMVRWPILCKGDEAAYRAEMRDFLRLLSQDNPDLSFPSVLMSHLIQSAGTKFQIIMWKLSQLALRAYIGKELQGELLNAPCTSPVQDLTVTYLNNTIARRCSAVTGTSEETKRILDATNSLLNDELEIMNTCKSEIFDRKENIKKLVLDLPAHPSIRERLMNVEDPSITGLWKRSILKKVQYVRKKSKKLNELEETCDRLCKLVLRINPNSKTLDANEFSEIRYDSLLYTQCETQHLLRNLHANGSIVFSDLLSLLYLTLTQIYHEGIADLSDLSQCLSFSQNACKTMKSLQTLFSALNVRVDDMYSDEQCAASREIKNARIDFDACSISTIANRNILLQSPRVSFNFEQNTDDELFHERLCLPPTEGKYKHLFRRYKCKYRPSRELPAALDFSNSWNNMSGWLSPRASHSKQILFKGKSFSPLYSRLLHRSKLDLKSREHVSHSLGANYEGLNLTPRKRPSKTGYLTLKGHGDRMRTLL